QPAQALLDAGRDIRAGIDVLLAVLARVDADLAGAFRCEDEVCAAVRERLADQQLAQPVVDGGVDVVDPEIDHPVEEGDGVALVDGAGPWRPCELHGAIAEPADRKAGPPHPPRSARELIGPLCSWHSVVSISTVPSVARMDRLPNCTLTSAGRGIRVVPPNTRNPMDTDPINPPPCPIT